MTDTAFSTVEALNATNSWMGNTMTPELPEATPRNVSGGHLVDPPPTRNTSSGVNVLGIGVIAARDSNGTQKVATGFGYNGTGFYIEDENEAGLSDLQTVFLACFSTLVFLAIVLLTAFGIRVLWKKYKGRKDNARYDGILHREATAESISTRPLHSHLLSDDNKSCDETQFALNTEVEVCNTTEVNTQIRSNHSSTNGSIITMTLKNNHLIVETEERNDLEEDSRETTMKYCPGARDGVFVVEVQQGVRRSPSLCPEPEMSISVSDQCALVHNPPERYSDEETLEECDDSEYVETASPNPAISPPPAAIARTGLTQSNTSLNNHPYCYTNQQGYDSGCYGYSVRNSEYNSVAPAIPPRQVEDTRPKITAAVYKSSLKRSPSTEDLHLACVEGSSPVLEKILMQNSNEEMAKAVRAGQEIIVESDERNSN